MMLTAAEGTTRAVFLIGVTIVVLAAVGIGARLFRRIMLTPAEPAATLDLERLTREHRAGRITDEEFRSLRRAVLGLGPLEEDPQPQDPDGESGA